ncbi:MAG: nucleotidyl transferase AbiEii/AbiGii toxin family protein [Patescibacteria group bacterium]
MYDSILSPVTQRVLVLLRKKKMVKDFYLAGGTALALQYGHRKSDDLDWFSDKDFSLDRLEQGLKKVGRLMVTAKDKGTWHGIVNRVRLTFLHYPYRLLWPPLNYNGINIADARDIACLKLQAISNRGSRKDFFDLYILLQQYSLDQLLKWFDRKYQGVRYNRLHLLKSLVYFNDAASEPNPILLTKLTWTTVKHYLTGQVKSYLNH